MPSCWPPATAEASELDALAARLNRTGLGEVIAVPGALEEDAYPTRRQRAGHPGLYFVGYNNVPTGLLREIGLEAEAVAADVAQSLTAR